VGGSWSLAERRYAAKQVVANAIDQCYRSRKSALFLTGIATGDFDDRIMTYEFSRFGLQHIMAISGFHFSIVASILSGLLRFLLPPKRSTLVMIGLLTSYFLFLGCGPSILRAWLTIQIALFGLIMQRKGSGLNALGLALLLSLLIDPLMCRSIGFQFSFLTTASILLFYGPIDHAMQQIFYKRPLSEAIDMDVWNQHGYCLLAILRQALSLGIAVNCAALPMTLYLFQKFPLFSLLYNLFFPFLVSISMLLLILGFLVPLLGAWIHTLNDWYTHCLLNFTYNLPHRLDIVLYQDVALWVLVPYLTLLLLGGIVIQHKLRTKLSEFSTI
jgi:competence protein ComEC